MPQIPQCLETFIKIVRADETGKIRTLQDLWRQDHDEILKDLLNEIEETEGVQRAGTLEKANAARRDAINEKLRALDKEPTGEKQAERRCLCLHAIEEHLDRDAIEDAIDKTFAEEGNLDQSAYADALENRLEKLYPDSAPRFVGEVIAFVSNLKPEERPESWDGVLTLPVRPTKAAKKKDQSMSGEQIFSKKFPMDDKLSSAFQEAYAAAKKGENWKQDFPASVRPKIEKLYPRANRKRVVLEGGNLGSEREKRFFYDACRALIEGDFTSLDPVIGDEACEARPPFVIDMWEQLQEFIREQGGGDKIRCLAHGYGRRHRNDTNRIIKDAQIVQDSAWSGAFVDFCEKFAKHVGDNARNYLKYCYANTIASVLAEDEWGIATYDRDKGVYTPDDKNERRKLLSDLSVDHIRAMAKGLLKEGEKHALFKEVCAVLDEVNVAKVEKVEDKYEKRVQCLPIYETMRTAIAWEFFRKRPIILSLYQIKCRPDGEIPRDHRYINDSDCAATYELVAVNTLRYVPDGKEGRFVPWVISSDNISKLPVETLKRPCLAVQAFHLVREGDDIPIVDDEADFSGLGDEYLKAVMSCDLSLLIQCYAAIHPVFAEPVMHPEEKKEIHGDGSLSYMESLYEKISKGEDWDEKPTRRSTIFSLMAPNTSLWAEYKFMRALAEKCGVRNKLYARRLLSQSWLEKLGGRQTVMARNLDSCAFTIHHMNTNSLEAVLERDKKALATSQVSRFHDLDDRKSYENPDAVKGAQEAKQQNKEKKKKKKKKK